MEQTNNTNSKTLFASAGAVGAALVASACCTLPLLLATLGIGGAFLTPLAGFSFLTPVFALLSLGLIGAGWYLWKRGGSEDCVDGSCRANAPRGMRTLSFVVLIAAGVVSLVVIVLPTVVGLFLK